MPSSSESDSEEEILIEMKKLEEQMRLLEHKLEKKREKRERRVNECQNALVDKPAVPSSEQVTKEEIVDFSFMGILPCMDCIEEENITSLDEDKRSQRFESKQKKKDKKLARIPTKLKLLSSELGEVRGAEYTRTGGQCSTSGAMYEVKVSALLYLRATVRHWDFLLGTNVEEAGKFDDVRLAYATDCGPRQMLVQLRHKESRSVSKAQLLADDRKKSKFSLLRYYKSFRDLRASFGSNAVLSSYSQFRDIDFVLFSNAAAELSGGLFTDDDLFTTCDSVLNMGGKVFNFAHNEAFIQEFKYKYAGDVDDEVVKEFFDQFYIYSDQTREENVQKLINDEIKTSCGISEYGVNKVSNSFVEYIQVWWKNRAGTRHLKLGDFQFESGLDIFNEFHTESPKLEFKPKELSHIERYLSNESVKIINFHVDVDICGPSCDKLAQSITENALKFFAVSLEDMESSYDKILRIWPSKLCQILVIKFETGMPILSKSIKEFSALVKESLEVEKRSKLFLVSKQGELGKLLFPYDKESCTNLQLTCEINHLTKECQKRVLQNEVNFQGSNVRLCSILGENLQCAIDAHLLSLLTYSDKVIQLGFLQGSKLPFYINRVLTCKNFLKKSVLRCSSRDVFAVSGLSNDQMKTFLNMIESSSDSENITSLPDSRNFPTPETTFHFENMATWYSDGTPIDSTLTAGHLVIRNIFSQLNEVICLQQINKVQPQNCDESSTTIISSKTVIHAIECSKEFSKLCTKYKHKNVHWLEVHNGKLRWKKSKGNWNVIQRNISAQRAYIPVNNVWDIPDRIVVVSGDSGMGKSSLLSQIAVNSKEERPETCIILIDLSECESDLKKLDLNLTPEEACDFIIRNSMSFEKSCQRSFNYFFQYVLRHTERAVLLVDGFGEVCPENECKIVNLIQSFVKLRLSKLWITSRSHMTSRLERITRTICFELQPLKMPDSLEIVRRCLCDAQYRPLSELKVTTDLSGFQLMENPLHCNMIAEAARIDTQVRCMLLGKKSSTKFVICTLTILEAITKLNFEIYFEKYNNSFSENKQIREMFERKEQLNQFIEYHEWSAVLRMLSLGIIRDTECLTKEKVKLRLKVFVEAVKSGSRLTGMINIIRNGIPQFEHKIYEEYFLALWLVDNCHGSYQNPTKSILQRIIFDPQFSFVINLFNQITSKDMILHKTILQMEWNSSSLPKILTINKMPDVNAKDKAGRTALHLVLSMWSNSIENDLLLFLPEKQKKVIGKLLRLGAKPDIKDDILKWSPFKYSNIRKTPWSIVALMMKEQGITKSDKSELVERVETQKQDALAGLAHAISYGNRCLVSFLLENGVDVNNRIDEMGDTAIIIAAARGQYETLKFLHINCRARPELTNHNGDSPLHWACFRGHIAIVKYLVNKCKISTDIENNTGYTPILAAARGGHLEIVRYLRDEHSSDPQGRTKLGESALCLAARVSTGDDIGVVKYLVEECGLKPKECEYGFLPFIAACVKGNLSVIRYLVEKCGIDPLENTKNGSCLLIEMIILLNVDPIKELVRCYKLSLEITDNAGRTLFMLALLYPKRDLCEYLQRKCANITNTDVEGNSALHFYIAYSKCIVTTDCVKWLVEKCHINPKLENLRSLTALQCAELRSRDPVMKYFIQPDVVDYLKLNA